MTTHNIKYKQETPTLGRTYNVVCILLFFYNKEISFDNYNKGKISSMSQVKYSSTLQLNQFPSYALDLWNSSQTNNSTNLSRFSWKEIKASFSTIFTHSHYIQHSKVKKGIDINIFIKVNIYNLNNDLCLCDYR